MMNLNRAEYISKVAGCWMGKNIGGTVGAPFEWHRRVNDITFYTQELDGNPLPNDDLDIQLLWLMVMEREGVKLDARLMGEYWLNFITPHWAEYGNAKINMRSGMVPPLSGSVNNMYKDSCGSFIRSELWACICPGSPLRAAELALSDSAIDHGVGEGTYAEIFAAALESAAFIEGDLNKLLDIGLRFIPEACAVAGAVRLARECHERGVSWREARDELLARYRGMTAYGLPELISKEDMDKGFFDGQLGFDAPSNIGIVVIGLLYSGGDFEKCMCITVNCGEDTDCTAATAGSVWGIINGIDAIPERWKAPVGNSIKTAVLNVGDIAGVPRDIGDLTQRTARLAESVARAYKLPLAISDGPTDLGGDVFRLLNPDASGLYGHFGCAVYTLDTLTVYVDYGGDPYIRENTPRTVTLHLENRFLSQQNLEISVYADKELTAEHASGTVFVGANKFDRKKTVSLSFNVEKADAAEYRAVVQMTSRGRHTAMLVPVLFLNGEIL